MFFKSYKSATEILKSVSCVIKHMQSFLNVCQSCKRRQRACRVSHAHDKITHTHTHTEAECVYNTPKDIKCTPAWFLCVRPVSVGFVSLMTFVLTLRILRVRGGTIRGIHRKTNIHYSFISSVRRDKL